MRHNQAVAQRHYLIPGSETLLSNSGTSSRTRYANAAFIRTSGLGPYELLCQLHNFDRVQRVRADEQPAELLKNIKPSPVPGHFE